MEVASKTSERVSTICHTAHLRMALIPPSDNAESLEISFLHLTQAASVFAYFLLSAPVAMLSILDEVAMNVVLHYYPAYDKIHSEIHVRICDIPKDNTLRDLRRSDLNCLVRVGGVVTRRTGVFPQLKSVKFNCIKCGGVLGPFAQDGTQDIKISFCPNCSSKGPFPINSELVCLSLCPNLTNV